MEKVDKPMLTTGLVIFCSLLETELHQNENEFFLSLAIEEIDKKIIMKI